MKEVGGGGIGSDPLEQRSDPPLIGSLLDEIEAHLKRYVVFSNPYQASAIALWVAHAWVLTEAFSFTPYLHIHSPEKRCGKSLVLDVLTHLVPNPWNVVGPSESVLFRAIDQHKPTLLFDEVDAVFSGRDEKSEGLRGILNAGFKNTGFVPRCSGSDHEVRNFSVYCPKVLAGIGGLPDTIADRCIPIVLSRKTKADKVERFRDRRAKPLAEKISESLKAWASSEDVTRHLRNAEPEMPEELGDRQTDICEPLVAIAELAGGTWPKVVREALVAICCAKTDDESAGVRLLRDIRTVFESEDLHRIKTSELLERLFEITDAPWAGLWERDWSQGNKNGPPSKMARFLKPFRIGSKTLKFADGSEAKGYEEEWFTDAWNRYL